MASEIGIDLGPGLTGITAYGMLRNASQQVWNTAGSAFEAFNAANVADYDIALTEQGSTGYFVGNMPAVSAGLYTLTVKQQAGGSPAVSDTRIGGGEGDWNGTAFQSVANISSRVPAALDDGYMAAKLANGVAHGGSTATLTLGTNGATAAFSVTNLGAGPAVKFDATNSGSGTAIQLFGGSAGMDVSGADYAIQLNSAGQVIFCLDSTLTNIEFVTLIQDIWAAATRTLTALDEDSTTLDIDATVRAAVGLASANLDTQLDALPTAVENADALLARNAAGGSNGGKTVAFYVQGGLPKVVQNASGTSYTIYGADGTTVLSTGTIGRLATTVGGVEDVTPA